MKTNSQLQKCSIHFQREMSTLTKPMSIKDFPFNQKEKKILSLTSKKRRVRNNSKQSMD